MIFVERSYSANPNYAWRAQYGDRFLCARTPDVALMLAWARWGGNVPALVYT